MYANPKCRIAEYESPRCEDEKVLKESLNVREMNNHYEQSYPNEAAVVCRW